MEKSIILGLVVFVVISAPAMASITITPDDGKYWTYQEWSFTAPPPPPAPSYGAMGIPADDGWVNSAPPKADVALTTEDGLPPPGWYDIIDTSNRQGIIFGNTATLDLHIPNIIDPHLEKIIQVEVFYQVDVYKEDMHGYMDAASYVEADGNIYYSVLVNDIELPDGWREVTVEWRIPQIYPVEEVHLSFINSIPTIYPLEAGYLLGSSMSINTGVAIDRISVATVCVPEPSTLLLLGGAGLIGWLRRRRAL